VRHLHGCPRPRRGGPARRGPPVLDGRAHRLDRRSRQGDHLVGPEAAEPAGSPGPEPAAGAATAAPPPPSHYPGDWRLVVAVFTFTSLVEGYGVAQIFAFLPQYLSDLGVPADERLFFVGIFSSLIFIVGMPLVPLWGVWADKYSRKTVIARSAVVEAVVLVGVALSREPWQLALSLLLVGLQLGNTGVMLAAIRDVTPRPILGRTIGIFGASTPIGFALGPIVGGLLVDGAGLSLSQVFLTSAALSLSTAGLVALTREVRPEVIPEGRVLRLAFGAVKGVLADPAVRRIFAVFFVAFLANQMARPYTPLLVEVIVGTGEGLASAVGFVTGTAALAGAIASPFGGSLGDRFGFRRILVASLAAGSVTLVLLPFMPTLPLLALAVLAFVMTNAVVGPMVFALLATEVPAERRSATLNLVYLPLYAAGVVGPAIAAGVASATGLAGPYLVGAIVLAIGAVSMARGARARAPG
jgi:MFS family permease